MTNEQFWKELDNIAVKGSSGENVFAFASVLVKGYCEGLNLFEIGMFDKDNDEMIRQLYSGDFINRFMHCSTAFEKGQQTVMEMDKRGALPPETKVCVTDISCKQILDNLYFKKEIAALVFNGFLDDMIVVPADLLRTLIQATGKASLPENYTPADRESYWDRTGKKTKKAVSVKEWAAKKCPPAYLVILFEGRCDNLSLEEEEKAAKIFCSQWKNVKKYIEKQNKKNGKVALEDFYIDYPEETVAEELSMEFYNIMIVVDMYLQNTRRYAEFVEFNRDMLELFENSPDDESNYLGNIGSGLWSQNPEEGEAFFKEHLSERNDIIMGYYTLYLLEEERWDDAEQALKGYEDTEDDTLIERFEWLKNRG